METDDWGGPVYYVNDGRENQYHWELQMGQAMGERGNVPLMGFVPATEENIKAQLDLVLSQDELWQLWEQITFGISEIHIFMWDLGDFLNLFCTTDWGFYGGNKH